MIGKTVANYEILELVGQGGMGEIYRGRDTRLRREVALKTLPERFAEDPERPASSAKPAPSLPSCIPT